MRTRRGKRAMLVSLAVLLLGAIAFAVNALSAPAKPDFSLSMASSSTTVVRNTSATNTVTITPSGGFAGAVSLSASGLPSGVGASFAASGNSRTVTLTASSAATVGTSTITVTGNSGSLTHTTSFSLVVTAPDFSIAANPVSLTLVRGQSGPTTVTLTPSNGFADSVTLSTSTLPAGISLAYASTNPSASTSRGLQFSVAATAAAGTYPITITGTSGGLQHSTSVSIVVPKPTYTLSVTNDNLNVTRGSSDSFNVAIARQNGFTDAVAFTVSGIPGNTTATFLPTSTTGDSVALQVATAASTVLGSYTLTVTGSGGGLTATTTAHLTVSAGSNGNKTFTITGSPTTLLAPGVTAPINVSITNSNNQPMQLTSLTVSITSISKAGCGADNYTLKAYSGSGVSVPANSTKSLSQLLVSQSEWPAITMVNKPVNQDVCKGATLQLAYSGTGSGS